MAAKKIGELLVDAGLITQEQLDIALGEGRQKGKRLGNLLVEKGFATELDIAETIAYQLNIPYIDLHTAVIEPEAIKLVPEKLARKHIIIPLYTEKRNILRIAMTDPLNMEALDDIRFSTNHQCSPMVATTTDILTAINTHYHLSLPIEDIVGDMVKEKFLEKRGPAHYKNGGLYNNPRHREQGERHTHRAAGAHGQAPGADRRSHEGCYAAS